MSTIEDTRSKMIKMLDKNEQILWEGNPVFKAYLLNRILPLLPIVLLWLGFDLFFIIMIFSINMGTTKIFMLIFFICDLFPVWKFIISIFTSKKTFNNEYYIVTDKRILLRHGFIGFEVENIYYQNIKDIHLHVGVIDRMCGVGDIVFQIHNSRHDYNGSSDNAFLSNSHVIRDIFDVETAFSIIQKATKDLTSDIYYPNDYRPNSNHGYNTMYHQ